MSRQARLTLPKGPIQFKYVDFRDNESFPGILFTSPYSGAKSTALVDAMIRDMQEYPGCVIFLIGATLTALKRTTIPKFLERSAAMEVTGSDKEAIYRTPAQEHPLSGLPVQSELRCLGLDRHSTEAIEALMKSTEPFRVYTEEANTISSDAHDVLISRTRRFAFHRTKTVRDLCIQESAKWGVMPEEAYEILKADKLHPIHQFDLPIDGPMPGFNYVKSVMNPDGNDHMWLRFVGKLHPVGKVTRDWAEKYIGIRELRFDKEERDEVEAPLIAGDLIFDAATEHRGYLRHVKDGLITFVDGHTAPEEDVDLIKQLYTIYGFSDENESRSGYNHQNSLLMRNRTLRRKAFTGHTDPREGLVFRNFLPEAVEKGGHILPFPAEGFPEKYNAIGGIDQGGAHSTAAVMIMLTKQTNTGIICFEYVRAGESAKETAYTLQSSIPGYIQQVRWGGDPAMWNREYYEGLTETKAQKYMEAGLWMDQGKKGDDAFDDVVDALYFRWDVFHKSSKADLYVYDNCPQTIEAMSTVTWQDIRTGRHKWIVDLADAIKLGWSMKGKMHHDPSDIVLPEGTRAYGGMQA